MEGVAIATRDLCNDGYPSRQTDRRTCVPTVGVKQQFIVSAMNTGLRTGSRVQRVVSDHSVVIRWSLGRCVCVCGR